jgi:hypothetical protein
MEHLLNCDPLAQKGCLSPTATSHLGVYASRRACQRDLAGRRFDDSHPSDSGGFALARGSASVFVDAQPVSTVCGIPRIDT